MHSEVEKKKRAVFDKHIMEKLGSSIIKPKQEVIEEFEPYQDGIEGPREVPNIESPSDGQGRPIHLQPQYDKLINAEVTLQANKILQTGRGKGRSVGIDGKVIGHYNDDPMLNTLTYEVEFQDGQVR